jgi:transcriptional regulator with XRE-family HTH domain
MTVFGYNTLINNQGATQMSEMIRESFKMLRKRMNVTQEQMAAFLDLEQSSISKFESGERTIGISYLEKACALFGISYPDLMKAKPDVLPMIPAFRKDGCAVESMNDIAAIQRIAMNFMEMESLLRKHHG